MATGHLFVTLGDILQLDCDAVLLSGERSASGILKVGSEWGPWAGREVAPEGGRPDLGWVSRERTGNSRIAKPAVAVLNAVKDAQSAVIERVVGAIPELAGVKASGRAVPRLALPLVSTGGGGGLRESATLLEGLVPTLRMAAREHRVDIVLVMYGGTAAGRNQYAAAQALRRRERPIGGKLFEGLLAEIRRGRLALFIGAGVSASAGLPAWKKLLERLYDGRRPQEGVSWADLEALDPLRAAQYVATLYDDDRQLVEEIARAIRADRYGLQHQLLAALPVREMVTTNYDDLIERACRDAGKTCRGHSLGRLDRSQRLRQGVSAFAQAARHAPVGRERGPRAGAHAA